MNCSTCNKVTTFNNADKTTLYTCGGDVVEKDDHCMLWDGRVHLSTVMCCKNCKHLDGLICTKHDIHVQSDLICKNYESK